MVKISFIASGIILGLATISSASASLISRGFLDEALENYATTTALDLKADKSDFTDLNTQISDSVDELRLLFKQGSNSYEFMNTINPEKYPNTISGAFGLLYGYLDEFADHFLYGWTDSENKTYLGVKGLNDKIGTLPDGLTVANLYNGWEDPSGVYINGLSTIAQVVFTTYDPLSDTLNTGPKPETWGSLDVLASLLFEDGYYRGDRDVLAPFWYLTKQAMRVGEIPHGRTAADMISEINNKIGTLPEGITVQAMYDGWTDSEGVIHKGLNDLSTITNYIDLSVEDAIAALMGYENGHKIPVRAVLSQLFMPIPEYPNFYNLGWNILNGGAFPTFAQEKHGIPGYKGLVDLTKAVGDLPSGEIPLFPGYEFFSDLNQPLTYPTSLAELITAIYGNSETSTPGLLYGIIGGFVIDTDGDGINDSNASTLSNFWLAKNASDLANANATKIGDLPTEYTTVGAALTAMDAKIDARELPSSSDDGQYVLSAKKVGDTITYTWVKMDLTNEEQAQ